MLTTWIGIPIGIYFLKAAPDVIVKSLLGIIITGFGLYNLIVPNLPRLLNEYWAYLTGLIAGILGGAYNTNGPPVVVYGMLRRWDSEKFRITLQRYFLHWPCDINYTWYSGYVDLPGCPAISVQCPYHHRSCPDRWKSQPNYPPGKIRQDHLWVPGFDLSSADHLRMKIYQIQFRLYLNVIQTDPSTPTSLKLSVRSEQETED